MKCRVLGKYCLAWWATCFLAAWAQRLPAISPLPDFDTRRAAALQPPISLRNPQGPVGIPLSPAQAQGLAVLQQRVPALTVSLDAHLGTPSVVAARQGFLTGRGGIGKGVSSSSLGAYGADDPHRVIKAFVDEHASFFGFDAEALAQAALRRDVVASHNGLRTVVWEQTLQDIPVFGALFQGHITAKEELARVSSHFIVNGAMAAAKGSPNWQSLAWNPAVSAELAVAKAAANLGENVPASLVRGQGIPEGADRKQALRAPRLKGDVHVQLVWLPMDAETMRLCWKLFLVSQSRPEMIRVLLDAETGSVVMRHNLTCQQVGQAPVVSLSAYTSDSPSPFSPGWSEPNIEQPPIVPRTYLTNFTALNSVASPLGWFSPATNGFMTTVGNNAHAHTDWNDDDLPDLPRPTVPADAPDFTFPLDLNFPPATYTNAAVVNLFYWNNFMHDRLYELGFTEAAGNYQLNNFGRGGFGGDPVLADAQDGLALNDPFYHANNANFYPTEDGIAGRMQMYIFDGPFPDRDGDLDAEIICHEYTHGLSNRLVGGGTLIWQLQSRGMGEGWSDFYPLCLLGEGSDDPNGNYAMGGYATYLLNDLQENYYYGIRRYPYSTDMTKNPLTFKDIDPTQADPHLGVPSNPVYRSIEGYAEEVHFQGEVWCSALWECRANLVDALGWAEGNQVALQLVTDGMKLSPPNPTFIEARDAILEADEINYGAANRAELWLGFAKRGMGDGAEAPPVDTTVGVVESFDLPPDVVISPPDGIMELNVTPNADATVLSGSPAVISVRVRDGGAVTNATVKGLVNDLSTVTFNNNGTTPDARARDSIYSGTINVPAAGTNLTLAVTVTAPGKQDAALTVNYFIAIRPPNDLFAKAEKVDGAGKSLAANNRFAVGALETGEPATAGVPSAASSLWWSWTPTATTRALIDTGGSRFNTLLAVYTGTALSNLKEVASAQTLSQQRKSYVLLEAKKGTNYFITVASQSTNNSGQIALRIAPSAPPDITAPVVAISKPVSGLIISSNTIEVVASAVDPGPISSGVEKIAFQVKPITGSRSSIFPTSFTDSTNRLALVEGRNTIAATATDGVGNVSDPVEITVIYRRQSVPNDHFNNAAALAGASGTATVANAEATREPGEPRHAGNDGGHSAWWTWTAPADGSLLISTENSTLDTVLGMYTGSRVDRLRMVASNDDAFASSQFSKLQQGVRAHTTYQLAVDGFNGSTGVVELAYSFAPSELFTINLQATAGGSVAEHDLGLVDVLAYSSQTLTAVPDAGFEFSGWQGAVISTANPISVQVDSNIVVRATFRPFAYTDDFETGDLSKLNWVTGSAPWTVTESEFLSGKHAARSGAIDNGQTTSLRLSGTFAAGSIAFALKVSSEAGWDYASFLIDGTSLMQWSGEMDWDRYSFPVTAGTHTLEWRYTKDLQNASGSDAVVIDNLLAPLLPPVGPASAATLRLQRMPQGDYELRLTGQTNQIYVIQQAAALVPAGNSVWLPFSTNVAAYGEVRIMLDPAALNRPQTYFRAYTK